MLSREAIKEWTVKWQTTEINVAREYLQHLFLSNLYQQPASDGLAFKGGTALRIAFGSPRFSEDLDFSANISEYHVGNLLDRAVELVEENGLKMVIEESKPTSGGFLSIYHSNIHEQKATLSCNVSLRKKVSCEAVLISSPLVTSYQCLILETDDLVGEKVQAALSRKKPRDFFDLYFLIRERRGLASIIKAKVPLLAELKKLDSREIQKELKYYLPASHQRIAASLPQVLMGELQRL